MNVLTSCITCVLLLLSLSIIATGEAFSSPYPSNDLRSIRPDIHIPPIELGEPRPGLRVRITPPEYTNTKVHHVLYLPKDWSPNKQYPVLVEYAGNGNYKNKWDDISTGKVEDS